MKAITVRGIDAQLEEKLKGSAQEKAMSVNQFILKSLRKVLGLEKKRTHSKEYSDLDFLFGAWSNGEFESFEKTQKGFQKIDKDMWK